MAVRHALLVCLVACSGDAVVVAPIIDVPVNDSVSGFPVDSITLSAAHAGASVDITSQTFTKGQTIQLGGIPFGDDIVLRMVGRIGTSDFSYGQTCTFTVGQNAFVPQPHLYFSRNAKFGQLGFTPLLRVGGAAVTYHDGSGILVGGMSPTSTGSPVTDVERFDPNTGEYQPLTTISARTGAAVAVLGTGTERLVAVIGGTSSGTGSGSAIYLETIEAENPADRRVEVVDDPSMTLGRVGLTATTLTSGDVVVIGGSGAGSACGSATDPSICVEQIKLKSGTVSVEGSHDNLLHGRWNHTATRLGDDTGAPVLVVGGIGAGSGSGAPGPVAEAELYKPLTGQFSTFPQGRPTMNVPRSRHQAVRMPDGSVLIIGGIDAAGMPVRQLESFTLDSGFTNIGMLPAEAGVVDFTTTTLSDGRVLITGGRLTPTGDPVASVFLVKQFNDGTGTGTLEVVPTASLKVARAGHGATLLCDGTVLISGGTSDPQPAERYDIEPTPTP